MSDLDLDFRIPDDGVLSRHVRSMGIECFDALARYVQHLPYGRVKGNTPIAVLVEQKGTCSSKHALLAAVASEAGRSDVELILGIFEMNEHNAPGIGAVLAEHGLAAIPEAHCYLRFRDRRVDFTGLPEGDASPFDALLLEERIDPDNVAVAKPLRHRTFIDQWAIARGLDPDTIWRVREECIEFLARGARRI